MDTKTYGITNVECPNCGNNFFGEEECQDLCFEPFNGTLETCGRCDAELSINMKVQVTVLNVPQED